MEYNKDFNQNGNGDDNSDLADFYINKETNKATTESIFNFIMKKIKFSNSLLKYSFDFR